MVRSELHTFRRQTPLFSPLPVPCLQCRHPPALSSPPANHEALFDALHHPLRLDIACIPIIIHPRLLALGLNGEVHQRVPTPPSIPPIITHHLPSTMSLSKFRTLLTTISTPKQKPQVTTTVRLLQATQSTKMSTGTPNPGPANAGGPMKPTEPKSSMIGGHAQYVKGMVNEKIGTATGSQEWIDSGNRDMAEGRGAMKVCIS